MWGPGIRPARNRPKLSRPTVENTMIERIEQANSISNWRAGGRPSRILRPASGAASTTHSVSQTPTAKIT
jgi:hypothetical protein